MLRTRAITSERVISGWSGFYGLKLRSFRPGVLVGGVIGRAPLDDVLGEFAQELLDDLVDVAVWRILGVRSNAAKCYIRNGRPGWWAEMSSICPVARKNRDDFTEATKLKIAKLAGWLCSFPTCRKPTVGATSDGQGVINIGTAAHICAAAPGGPRYDPNMSPEERAVGQFLVLNGIDREGALTAGRRYKIIAP